MGTRNIKTFGDRIAQVKYRLENVAPDADGLKEFLLLHYEFTSPQDESIFDLILAIWNAAKADVSPRCINAIASSNVAHLDLGILYFPQHSQITGIIQTSSSLACIIHERIEKKPES